ncbi:glycoside hydrolase family 53 protein [Robertkochia flava]|uniref:glycoside hydrolase family 53 protein n=1 Tax=Robertkochia flava TaxID=3447986 RepID=UPI001CC9B52C|nr:glycosyl hydrolase 53 family protein [Robertkochia marina]
MRTPFKTTILAVFILQFLTACQTDASKKATSITPTSEPGASLYDTPDFFYGADLSYVNELEDCGAIYYDHSNTKRDPYMIFKEAGANLIRLRLWHDPDWTEYSTLPDVKRSIKRARASGIPVLLDFHYSDDWADPQKQEIPKAWEHLINDTELLGSKLYDYTYTTLKELNQEGLLPEMVQVGNEINGMILRKGESKDSINWTRNSYLLKKGVQAVRKITEETGKDIGIMLHIAQPENAIRWFREAKAHGITDYDWIGISYYPQWSDHKLETLEEALSGLITTYDKKLMIVETAYPYTLDNGDAASNIMGENALLEGYPATQEGQLDYLLTLRDIVKKAGGQGIVYWEPAWISSSCETRWGKGSHWDNATLFDQNGKANLGMNFYYNALNSDNTKSHRYNP